MRSVYIIILVAFALFCSDTLAATSKTDQSEFTEADLTKNKHKGSLRGGAIADGHLYAIDEERVHTSGISKVAKELQLKKQNLKKVSAALEKVKGNPSKLGVSAKKMKAIAEKKILAKLSSMENDNFVRLFKANFTPQRAKSTGKIKNSEQFTNYEEFYKLAKLAGLNLIAKERFNNLVTGLLRKGFPTEGYHPFYAVSIDTVDGILADTLLLQRVEASMRNVSDRKRLRFRQHAQGEDHTGNLSNSSETWEFVLTDEDCGNTFTLMQRLAIRLDAARCCVQKRVYLLDRARKREIQRTRNELTEDVMATFDEESVARVAVHKLYFRVIEYAAASIDI